MGACVAAVMADGEYAAPAYEKKYDGYFQYANVPGNDEYEFGYNRGNPSHYTSRYEQSKDHRFRTKVIIISFYCVICAYYKRIGVNRSSGPTLTMATVSTTGNTTTETTLPLTPHPPTPLPHTKLRPTPSSPPLTRPPQLANSKRQNK